MSTSVIVQSFFLAIFSALFNAFYGACGKLTTTPVDPVVFTFCNSIGVFISGFVVIPTLPGLAKLPESSLYYSGSDHLSFSFLDALAGTLYMIAVIFPCTAIHYIGLGMVQGVWGGTGILVSFLWDILAFRETVQSTGMAFLSLSLLIRGVTGIALNQKYFPEKERTIITPVIGTANIPICYQKISR